MKETEIRQRLELELKLLQKKIKQYEELTRPIAPDNAIGRVSRMDAINNKGVMQAALVKARERKHGLEHHLDLVGSSDFGICPRCKSDVPLERILLAPQSTFCVNCAS